MNNRWEIAMPHRSGLKLLNPCGKDETFVKIDGTNRFYVSTYGQVAEKKKNGRFRMITPQFDRVRIGYIGERKYRTVFIDSLVAKAFLVAVPGRNCIWHKDGDRSNCHYRNLIYVTKDDCIALIRREIKIKDLPYIQYYYPIWAFSYRLQKQKYVDMVRRCKERNYGVVCNEWLNDFNAFARWLEQASYPDIGCVYHVDKDILKVGNTTYSPENCCLVPRFINIAYEKRVKFLHEEKTGKYSFVQPGTTGKRLYFDTKKEACSEYIKRKGNYIRRRAVKNRYAVTDKIYHAMIDYANSLDKILWGDMKWELQ